MRAATDPGQLIAQQVLPFAFAAFLLFFPLSLQQQKIAIVAAITIQSAAIDLDDPVGNPVEKVTVMRNHQQGAVV